MSPKVLFRIIKSHENCHSHKRIEHQPCRVSGGLHFDSVSNGNSRFTAHGNRQLPGSCHAPLQKANDWKQSKHRNFATDAENGGSCKHMSLLEEFFVYIKVWTQFLGNINRKNSKTVLETSWKLSWLSRLKYSVAPGSDVGNSLIWKGGFRRRFCEH